MGGGKKRKEGKKLYLRYGDIVSLFTEEREASG